MEPAAQHEAFVHLRVLIGIVVGLALTRLLLSLARLVQRPGQTRIPAVWLGWTIFMLIAILHLWWFEFGLSRVSWRFETYAFTVFYASLYFFTCAVLTPETIDDFGALRSWFEARRTWFYSLLAALLIGDLADTALKGTAHFQSLGVFYPVRQVSLAAGALVAARLRSNVADLVLLVAALASQVMLILMRYDLLAQT